jgi:tetratricopeptide (TPR) repeat protein
MSVDKAPSLDPEELRGRVNSLIARYKETCSAESLDELFEVLVVASTNLPDRAHVLSQLSAVRLDRFRIRGDAADLAGAVESARSSLALTAPGQTLDLLMRKVNLGAALLEVTSRGGSDELNEAIELLREAGEGLPVSSDERAVALANLCDGLRLCAERTGNPQYLVDAIAVGQEAAVEVSSPSRERSAILTNYANALRTYARRTAEWSSLDSAIQYHRRAILGAPAEDLRRLGYLDDFAVSLYSRFELRGESNDLDEAIEILERAVNQSPGDDPNLGSRLTNLSVALRLRFKNLGGDKSLSSAREKAREAVAVTPRYDEKLPGRLSNLASILLELFGVSGEHSILEEGVEAFRQALDLLPEGHSLRPVILTNLANALRSRAYALNQLDDLTEAFSLGKEALLLVAPGDPLIGSCSNNLAMILQAAYSVSGEDKFLDAAIDLVRATAMGSSIPITIRLAAAQAWGEWSGRELSRDRAYLSQAVEGYAVAVSLLPTLAWPGLLRTSQERALAGQANLPGLAAAYATEARLAEGAVAILELGRSVLWRQLIDISTDLEELRKIDSNLAHRMTSVRSQLDQLPANRA